MENNRRIGNVLVRKARGRLGNWKNRRLVIGDGELSYGKKGSPPTRIALNRIIEVKLVNRYGEFVVDLDDGSCLSFRSVKRGMEEAMEWIRIIKGMISFFAQSGSSVSDWPSGGSTVPSNGGEEWPDAQNEQRNDDGRSDNDGEEEIKINNFSPKRDEPCSWSQVDPEQWWCSQAILADGNLQMNQGKPTADPFGLIDFREEDHQQNEFMISSKHFVPKKFLTSFHHNTTFTQFQLGLHTLRRKLGTQDHRLHALIRDDIADFVQAARDVEALSLLFDNIHKTQSNLHYKHYALIQSTHTSLQARFDHLLSNIDKTDALLTASNLLLLFSPVVAFAGGGGGEKKNYFATNNDDERFSHSPNENKYVFSPPDDHIVSRWRTVLRQAVYDDSRNS